ncbi:hypothetical protein EJ05DRAFT_184459 [Pseudovirgaria hyperparasitica]|uniref:Sulfate transporter family protein-like protein n=1 Tax=Pseudovirgaria hyperparasitica TaxID=470096 RepID=A0A6A6WI52_9PEZI|nr:uncharacterized protein EJ05DRAFT_184459 [Pseudovirgaria hyperparasitica]KAF2761764.1 hypothetical protein EJ05DRAFT_184459 [Pseudovirgaria hyperparasitica]
MTSRSRTSGESSRYAQGSVQNDERKASAAREISVRDSTDSNSIRSYPTLSGSYFSSSYSSRTPARSFFHQASHAPLDNPQYASLGVREKTQELAKYALGSDTPPPRRYTTSEPRDRTNSVTRVLANHNVTNKTGRSVDSLDETSLSEPLSHQPIPQSQLSNGKSTIGSRSLSTYGMPNGCSRSVSQYTAKDDERQPLLNQNKSASQERDVQYGTSNGLPSFKKGANSFVKHIYSAAINKGTGAWRTLQSPETWSSKSMKRYGANSVKTFSAVFLGTLLNILDGLSYGLILFPLGHPIFANTGPDGISMYYVSCIVSQLVFSLGATVFKGGVGSEMIEVVPFFHKMTYAIMAHMGEDDPAAVMATVIVSYAMSSILTGLIFLALGTFKLGNLVSFFPRNILTGCIGGVGFFLFVTGIEVSARIDGNLEYNYATLLKLFQADTIALWVTPLVLSIAILLLRTKAKSPLIMPAYYTSVAVIFYIVVKGIMRRDLEDVRASGWIFPKPEAGVPFYRFYSYFQFGLVNWGAIAQTIPSMFALSFFGIIHVPINVPALGLAVKEDNVDINRELIAHGLSNTLSGCVGSIQNYLVYANSYLVYQNGGDTRIAGLLLALATTAVWIAGPAMIGFIPVCVVGTLIFMLGIELLGEAVWDTWGKLHKLEYMTIIVIVLIMGIYDFVVGIVTGIVLACLNYVVQTSRTPAIRASYNGRIAESTVRRPPMDKRYLNQVSSQIRVEKLSGFLFFGTIVAVEAEIRALIDEEAYRQRPVRYVIIDFKHVTGIDFSAAEAFQRISRILHGRMVTMILSSVSFTTDVGKSLNMVGLFDSENAETPRVYEDLNNALEACENELIEVFHKHRLGIHTPPESKSISISPPRSSHEHSLKTAVLAPAFSSPRGNLLLQAAAHTIEEHGDMALTPDEDMVIRPAWKHFSQPVKIMLQTFEDVSAQNEDFWQRAALYFTRRALAAGTVLYSRGDEPDGFFLLESGRFRADYSLDQGSLHEIILPGTTCGELPFFSDTQRTSTVAAEQDSVAWLLTRERWGELEREDGEVARELLKVGFKLTSERMTAITSYMLVTAS